MYDYLVVGAGLYGAVFAQRAAAKGKRVLVIDRRDHIAGNAYTEDMDGIIVHRYGPHIFHTDNRAVWDYVNSFAEFNSFVNSPLACYKGRLYSLPFNMYTFNQLWGVSRPEEAMAIINEQRREISGAPQDLEEQAVSLVGREIFEKLVKGYTEKQWGRSCRELPPSIIKRLPVRFTYNNNYFDSGYQGIPIKGYTALVEELLRCAEVRLGTDFIKERQSLAPLAKNVIYTGQIDEYFGYSLGALEYRSLRFEQERLSTDNFQGNAVVNYTDSETPYTRIVEHKWFCGGGGSGTVISKEYSAEWSPGAEPFYPINDRKNELLYKKYRALADGESGVIFGGRLGLYKYLDMDKVVEAALELADRLLG